MKSLKYLSPEASDLFDFLELRSKNRTDAVQLLLEQLSDLHSLRSKAAIVLLGQMRLREASPMLIEILNSYLGTHLDAGLNQEWQVAREVCYSLGQFDSTRSHRALGEFLEHASCPIQMEWATYGLGVEDVQCEPDLLLKYCKPRYRVLVRASALDSIANIIRSKSDRRHRNRYFLKAIGPLLLDKSPLVRMFALSAVCAPSSQESVAIAKQYINDYGKSPLSRATVADHAQLELERLRVLEPEVM